MIDYVLEISFPTDASLEEIVQSRLFLTDSSGSTAREAEGTTIIAAYFESAGTRDAALGAFDGLSVALRPQESERLDWLERYQQSLQAIEIGERFLVAPDPSLFPVQSDRLRIVVPQEQAFGTGSHETTALCMMLLETLDLGGLEGLDVGSGSGILALAMLGLGARRVLAFDNDGDAFGALRDNRVRNGVGADQMPLFIGATEVLRAGTFDVVTMNIVPEVIIPTLGWVVRRMNEAGQLVLSGVLINRRDEVIDPAAAMGLAICDDRRRGEWWAGLFQRRR